MPWLPTARQVLLVGQAIPAKSLVMPEGWPCQVAPPSVDARTVPLSPTTRHSLSEGQLMPGNPGIKGSSKFPDTDAPTFGAKTLSVSPDKLKAAATGTAYSASLSVSGGTPPYAWAVLGLPPGLSASGAALSGTPTSKGAFTVIVVVSDSAKPARQFGSRAYTLKVT